MTQSFHYKISGEGIPFIFQHGLGANLMQAQSLLENVQGVQLISMDCPGHGNAALPAEQLPSFDYYANELLSLMKELSIDKAMVGGISMGAGIAIKMALQYPEKVSGLVLVRPAWLEEGNPENLSILTQAATYIETTGLEAFKKEAAFQKIQEKLPNAAASVLGVFANSQRIEIPLVLNSMVADKPFSDISDLAGIDVPSLIIGNEQDPLHPFSMAIGIKQYLPNSQLKKVVSRYVDNDQHKRLVNHLVNEFISNEVL